MTALHIAAWKGHHNVVAKLLQHGADINLSDYEGDTALHDASGSGHHDIVTLLLQHGADINLSNKNGESPLRVAERCNHLKCVSILKERSIIESDNVDKFREVFGNVTLKLNEEVVSWISKLKPPNIMKHICACLITEEEAATPEVWQHEPVFHEINLYRSIKLTHCKMYEDTASVNLINAEALLDGPKCALQLAVDSKSHIMIREVIKLIEENNDVISTVLRNYQDRDDTILDILYDRKASLEAYHKRGYTRLDIAVMDCSKIMLQYLLEKETDKNIISKALALAIDNNCRKCVRILTEKNAEFNYKDNMGKSLVHLAIEKGNADIFQTLLEKCINYSDKDYFGLTALHKAVIYNEESFIEELVKKENNWNTNLRILKPRENSIFGTSDESDIYKIYQNQLNTLYHQLTTKETTLSLHIKVNNGINEVFSNIMYKHDVQCQDGLGNTMLHTAVIKCNVETCTKIIEISKEILNMKNFENLSPLRLAVRKYKENCTNKVKLLSIIKYFIQLGASLEQDETDTKSVLQEALDNEDEELLIGLVDSRERIHMLTDTEFKVIIERQFDTFIQLLPDKLQKGIIYRLITEDIIMDLFKKGRYAILKCFYQQLNPEMKKSSVNEYLYIAYKEGNTKDFVTLCKLNDIKPKLLDNGESIMSFIINDNNKTFYSHLLDSTYMQQLVNMSNYAKELPLHLIIKKEWYDLSYSVLKYTENVDQENEEGDTPIAILIKQLGKYMDDIVQTNKVMELIKALIAEGNSNIYRVSNVVHRSPISYSGNYRLKIEDYYKKYGKVQQISGAGALGVDVDVEATTASDKERKLKTCLICEDRNKDCALDCGHIFCTECVKQLDQCPTCREQIRNARKLFF